MTDRTFWKSAYKKDSETKDFVCQEQIYSDEIAADGIKDLDMIFPNDMMAPCRVCLLSQSALILELWIILVLSIAATKIICVIMQNLNGCLDMTLLSGDHAEY
jgi:hypothetical protein